MQKRYAYRVTVRMDDGSARTLSQSSPPAFAVGDKVRPVDGALVRA
jgi:outer membrane lipoprotein SlyB